MQARSTGLARRSTCNNLCARQRLPSFANAPRRTLRWRYLAVGVLVASHALASSPAITPGGATGKQDGSSSLLSADPRSWAVDASANELIALHHTGMYLRY